MTESLPDNEDLGLVSPGDIRNDEDPEPEPADKPFYSEVTELTPEERSNFETLITFGKKESIQTVYGHSVYLSTLTVDEELQVGLLVKPYLNTDAYHRAYKTAVVAASVKEIDGQPVYSSLSPDEDDNHIMRKKWDKIKRYYPVVVDKMYDCVTNVELELIPLIDKISKKTSG